MWKILFLLYLTKTCWTLYSKSSNVVELTSGNFDPLVINSEDIWLVEFFEPSCGHCQQLAPEYLKAADSLKGVAKVGALNGEEQTSLTARFNVEGYPTIKIFGVNKDKPSDYSAQRNSYGLIEAVLSAIRNKVYVNLGKNLEMPSASFYNFGSEKVTELTEANFDELVSNSTEFWMVEFYSPQCEHCKKLSPIWSDAARELEGKVKFGALDATLYEKKANFYNIRLYPTIKLFKPDRTIVEYKGGRLLSEIVEWSLEQWLDYLPPPQLTQITHLEEFGRTCLEKPLCVIAFLPHILECQASCRNEYLDTLTAIASKFRRNLWGWTWSEAIQQSELEDSLEIEGIGYPSMAVVNFNKMIYSLLRGAFSKEGIDEFLSNISYGKGRTSSVKDGRLPKIITTTPWDGNDMENIEYLSVEETKEKDEL